ncbi:MAG: trypsin-like peptidase domain-containing protein [Oscillospiraceae bacterium]|nr:trypsin-like peptidase domain-containing protein [Oscillospiraceae bacterium]
MGKFMKRVYIKKKGKFKTVLITCLATVVFGGAVGLGGSQLLIEALQITDNFQRNPTPRSDINRDNLPDVFNSTAAAESPGLPSTRSPLSSTQYTAEEIYEMLSDTVVGIKTASMGISETSEVIGSGVVISEDGFIITCAHVIDGASKVVVVVDDYDNPNALPHEYEATVYGSDSPSDLAVIKIERDEPFSYAKIGNSSDLAPGQTVVAIGNPVGLMKTVTQGIVSGLQRDLGDNPYMLPSIQTDAALNPGNSGCPLFNMRGEIVGIVNSKLVYGSQLDNLGFAISITEAMPIITELTSHGFVTSRAMLGITGRELSPMYGEPEGFWVETVRPGTPAAESGLSRGDIIISINGEKVAVASDIQSIMKDLNVGDVVTVRVIRYNNFGESQELDIKFALTSAE